ncbi:MAG: universal stress protein [Candidatus Binataceae bacterium]
MLRFGNILCPVDFDQNSLAAVPVAAELARERNATLHLLHVIDERGLPSGKIESAAQIKLERISRKKLKAGTRYEILVMPGDPAVEVPQMAVKLGIDLIVMATHGRKGLRRLVLGSVAERVVREARCPVLTVKPKAARAGASRTRPRP